MKPTPSLAVAFATIERPQAAQRLIRSIRRYFPDLPLYVADQSRQLAAISAFYEAHGARLVRMPYDIGVAASRNQLVQEIVEDYFVLCDDDFIFGPRTDFADAMRVLTADDDLGVVGGRLYDFEDGSEWVRNWELFLEYDRQQKILFSIPIYDLAPKAHEVNGIRYYLCDAVLNFALFRKSIFGNGVGWDEQFKSNGEHEDFYLNLKLNSRFTVAHLPTMIAYHHHPAEYRAYRTRLRDRNEGWLRFFRKWGLEQHVEFGLGVRTIDDLDAVFTAEQTRSRFFVNANLSLQRPQPAADTLLIGDFEEIATTGALDETGDRSAMEAPMARLLLDPESRRLVAVPAPAAAMLPEEAGDRYRLETFPTAGAIGFLDEGFFFRYDPILHGDTDTYLWYRRDAREGSERAAGRSLACVVRWSDNDGRILAWKSERKFLALEAASYWLPLLLEPPLRPRDCRWLRFDVVADGGPSPDPICTGFLFAGPVRSDGEGIEVLALSRLANDGAAPGQSGRPLAEIGLDCSRLPLPGCRAAAPGLMLLPTDAIAGLEALFFVGWEELGRSLVSARLPRTALGAPAALALPAVNAARPLGEIFGYGAETGFVALAAAPGGSQAR